jgi:hypothetical protein
MAARVLLTMFLVIFIPLLLKNIVGNGLTQAAEDFACAEKGRDGICQQQDPIDRTEGTYHWNKPEFSPNQKPNAFWSSKPTGRFTKEEIFHVCAGTAILGYTGLDAKVKGKSKDEALGRLPQITAEGYESRNQALKERDLVLFERARKLFLQIGDKLYDTAYNGGEQSLANMLQRDGFEQFYPKLISGCYKNLASW